MQIHCPYCNAPLDAAVSAAGPRIRCPRCGDSFPNRWVAESSSTSAPVSQRASASDEPIRRSNRVAALIVLGVMSSMAAVGLAFMLWTAPQRQSRHANPIKIFASEPHQPAQLPGLGYLPFDSKIVAAIHVADLHKEKLGQQLLEKPRWQPLDWALERIKLWTDLPPDAIDHIVAAVHAPRDELPGVVLVVQTRRPYSVESLKRLHNSGPEKFYDRPLFRFDVQPLGSGRLWCANERTLVFMLRLDEVERSHLDRIPVRSQHGMEGLPDNLQRLINDRLPAQSVAWIVGDLGGLTANAAWLRLAPLPEKLTEFMYQVRTVAAGIRLQEDATIVAALEGADTNAAYTLQNTLEKFDGKSLKVLGLPPLQLLAASSLGMDPLMNATVFSQTWLLVQYRGDASAVRELVKLWRK